MSWLKSTRIYRMEKKRSLLDPLNNVITALVALHADAAKLEFVDNDLASRRLKRDLAKLEITELKAFKRAVLNTRDEMNSLPPKSHIKHNKQFKKKQNGKSEPEQQIH